MGYSCGCWLLLVSCKKYPHPSARNQLLVLLSSSILLLRWRREIPRTRTDTAHTPGYASCRCRRGDGSVDFPGFSSNGRNLREHHNDSSNSSTRAHIHKTSTPVRTVSPKTEIAGRDCTTTSIDLGSQRGKRGDNPSYELAQNGGRDSADLRVDRRMLWV